MVGKMKNVLKKIKKVVESQPEEQKGFLESNPKQYKALKKLIATINAIEDHETRVSVVRGLTYVLLLFSELSYVECLGILSCVEGQIKDNLRAMMVVQNMQKNNEKPQGSQMEGGYIW